MRQQTEGQKRHRFPFGFSGSLLMLLLMMKVVLALFLVTASPLVAGLDIPRYVFGLDQLEEAKAEAAEKEQPLVFVYTDPGST